VGHRIAIGAVATGAFNNGEPAGNTYLGYQDLVVPGVPGAIPGYAPAFPFTSTRVYIYVYTSPVTNLLIGAFSPDNPFTFHYTCHDVVNLGTITGLGFHEIPVAINILANDSLAYSCSSGSLGFGAPGLLVAETANGNHVILADTALYTQIPIFGVQIYADNYVYPTVSLPATLVSQTSAVLNGSILNEWGINGIVDGILVSGSFVFEWGLTTAYGNYTAGQTCISAPQNFSQMITGLIPKTTYHFRALGPLNPFVPGPNPAGTPGADMTFTTLDPTYPSIRMTYPVKRRLT
jgi:hypothetical protein